MWGRGSLRVLQVDAAIRKRSPLAACAPAGCNGLLFHSVK